MKQLSNYSVRRCMRRLLAIAMILSLVLSWDLLVLAGEIRDKAEEEMAEWKEEQQKDEIKRQQQEYIEENRAGDRRDMDKNPDNPDVHAERKEEADTEAGKAEETLPGIEKKGQDVIRQPELEDERMDELEAHYGAPVEMFEYGKVFQTDTGSYKFISTTEPNLYRNEKGELKEIDNTLIEKQQSRRSRGTERTDTTYYTNKANSMHIMLPAKMTENNGIVLTAGNGEQLEILPQDGDYSRPSVLGNAVLYNDVSENVDIQYTVRGDSVKEDIILREKEARHSFSYAFSAEEYGAALENNVIAVWKRGVKAPDREVLFYLTAPLMTDASGSGSAGVVMELEETGGRYVLTVTGDEEWLASEERVYPVKIDPTITIPAEKLSVVTTTSKTGKYAASAFGYVGYASEAVTGVKGGDLGKTRMFFQLNYNMKKLIPEEAVVQSAYLHMYEYSAYASSATYACYRLKQNWIPASISWENSVGIGREIAGENATVRAGNGWKSFDIRQSVNDWSTGIAPSYGLMVMAQDETQWGAAFFTPDSNSSVQPTFTPDKKPYIEINWVYPNPVDPAYSLDKTTVNLRSMIDCDMSGRLAFQGVFADGLATPESVVTYQLNDTSKKYGANVSAGHTKRYPNSEAFEGAFSKTTTRYRDKQGNWQTVYPFVDPDYNVLYQIEASAAKNGKAGQKSSSDRFTVYKVKQYDTLPKIASYYGIPLSQISFDNRVQDMLLTANNTLFIRNPKKNAEKPYNPPPLDDKAKAQIDAQLMGRGLHCEFGFEPVNLNTGNFYLTHTDASVPDFAGEFSVERNYNSKGASYISPFGRGWQFSYGEYLSKMEDGTLIYTRGDGSSLYFAETEEGVYSCPEGYDYDLKRIKTREKEYDFGTGKVKYPVYEYEITDTDNVVRRFDCFGSMTKLTDEKGNATVLSYDKNYNLTAVTSPAGSVYGFTMTEDGKVAQIALPNGGKLSYAYDDDDNLIRYTDACGSVTRYEYDDMHCMTAWHDGKDNCVTTNIYDSEGRVIRQKDANGYEVVLTYDEGKTVTVDGNENRTVYTYDDQFRTTSVLHAYGTKEKKVYDENRLVQEIDEMGHAVSYAYDADGNITKETLYDGTARTYMYDGKQHLLSESDYGGTKTEYSYDKAGNLTTVKKAGKEVESCTYDSRGRITSRTDALGNTTRYAYEGAWLKSITDPLGSRTSFTYNAMGQVTGKTDGNGHTVLTGYDLEGRIIRETDGEGNTVTYMLDANGQAIASEDANGNMTTFVYDGLGNLVSGSDGEGSSFSYAYDGNGNCIRETDAKGKVADKTYDSRNRLTSESDVAGNTITYEYDAIGNVIKETDAKGSSMYYTYDYVSGKKASDTDESGASITYEYSSDGRLLVQQYPDGTKETYEYDAFGQEIKRTEVNGLVIKSSYDAAGNLTEIDKEGVTASFDYDATGRLTRIHYPNGGTERYDYDGAGNIVCETDLLGKETHYEYDGAGRPVKRTDATGAETIWSYDGNGNLTSETDGKGNTIKTEYNVYNRLSAVTDSLGYRTVYEYNENEELTAVTDASGRKTAYEYNVQGLPVKVTNAAGSSYEITYDANGNYTSIVAPDGGRTLYTYNRLNQIVKEEDSEGLTVEYAYDVNGDVTKQWDNNGGKSEYTYDVAGHILTETDALGQTTAYTYDKYGNLVRLTESDGNETSYTYDVMGNVSSITDAEGKSILYTYDKKSQLIRKEEGGRVEEYAYDEAGRLLTEKDPSGGETSYTYDKAGNLLTVTDAKGGTEMYDYDAAGHVIGQTDANGNLTTMEYDEIGRILASVSAEGGRTSYLYDSTGSLSSYTDMEGAVTSYAYDCMGRVTEKTMPEGGSYTYKYDTHGNVLEERTPEGDVTTFEYDRYDQLVKRTLPGKAVYGYAYDALGRITQMKAPENGETTYTYDRSGNLVREADQSGRSVKYAYDKMHRLTQTSNPLNQKTSYTYDEHGNLNSIVTPLGHETGYEYDALDRIRKVTEPAGKVTELAYDAAGNLKHMEEYGGKNPSAGKKGRRITTYTYDKAGNKTSETNPLGETTDYLYDAMNRIKEETDAAGHKTGYEYDKNSNLTEIIDAKGGEVRLAYDGDGNLTGLTDGSGRKAAYAYDQSDRLIEAAVGVGTEEAASVQYVYDGRDNLVSRTDGNGYTTRYAYNLLDQMTSQTNALGQKESYKYDDNGRLSQVKRASGRTIQYEYNKLDELTMKEYSEEDEGEVLFAYDQDGRRVSMKNLAGSSVYTYDDAGRITGVKGGDGSIILYHYDDYGNINEIIYPDGSSVAYTYDKLDRLTAVTDRSGEKTSYKYDASGCMTHIKRPNGTESVVTYDELNQLTGIENLDVNGKVISAYSYMNDLSGNILIEIIRQDGNTTRWEYGYNERGELQSAVASGAVSETITYGYDKAGNKVRITRSAENAGKHLEQSVKENRFSPVNQLLDSRDSKAGITTYEYDMDGNLIRELGPDEEILTYSYDTENRLRAVKDNRSLLQSALYDGDGNRIFVVNRKIVSENEPVFKKGRIGSEKDMDNDVPEEGKDAESGRSGKRFNLADGESESEEKVGFWYGFFQNLSQGFSVTDLSVSDALHRYWDKITGWVHVHILGDEPDEEGIVKNPVKVLPEPEKTDALPETGEERKEALYDTVLIPYGIEERDWDTYEATMYINDVNREYAESLIEYGTSGNIKAVYEYGSQRLSREKENKTEYYMYDGRGSVANLTGRQGTNMLSYSYDVYGEASASAETDNPYTFNGEYTDALTGNQYLRARYYNPRTGSFLTEDSELGKLLEPVTQNRYTYAGNDPVNMKDPSGHGFLSNVAKKIAKTADKVKAYYGIKPKPKVKSSRKSYTVGRAQNRKSGYGSIYAGPEYGGYSAYLKNRGRSSQMGLGEAVRNVVRIGSKLVARYEAKSCTTAEKAKKQKGGASAGVLVGSAVGDLLWNSGRAAVVSGAVRASGSAHVIVGGVVAVTVWWMNPIEAGESEEDVEKAQKKWEEAEKSKGESEKLEQQEAEKARWEGKARKKHKVVKNKSSLPSRGEPNSSADLLNPDGTIKQRRYYGPDGKAQQDIDYNHTDDGTHEFPHNHDWDWSKNPPRQ